jgi:hypothetical protein
VPPHHASQHRPDGGDDVWAQAAGPGASGAFLTARKGNPAGRRSQICGLVSLAVGGGGVF